nr:hypothetical protein Iba_chr11aCG15150 [Ipomoea batatas]
MADDRPTGELPSVKRRSPPSTYQAIDSKVSPWTSSCLRKRSPTAQPSRAETKVAGAVRAVVATAPLTLLPSLLLTAHLFLLYCAVDEERWEKENVIEEMKGVEKGVANESCRRSDLVFRPKEK